MPASSLSKTLTGYAGWSAVGTGDLNGDNRIDVLWHNGTTGQVRAWYLNGGTVIDEDVFTRTRPATMGLRIVSH